MRVRNLHCYKHKAAGLKSVDINILLFLWPAVIVFTWRRVTTIKSCQADYSRNSLTSAETNTTGFVRKDRCVTMAKINTYTVANLLVKLAEHCWHVRVIVGLENSCVSMHVQRSREREKEKRSRYSNRSCDFGQKSSTTLTSILLETAGTSIVNAECRFETRSAINTKIWRC